MTNDSLSKSLETYLKTEGANPTAAELPQIAALRMMARTLDDQADDAGPAASLLSAYARELARFQKGRADHKPADPLAAALNALSETSNDTMTDS